MTTDPRDPAPDDPNPYAAPNAELAGPPAVIEIPELTRPVPTRVLLAVFGSVCSGLMILFTIIFFYVYLMNNRPRFFGDPEALLTAELLGGLVVSVIVGVLTAALNAAMARQGAVLFEFEDAGSFLTRFGRIVRDLQYHLQSADGTKMVYVLGLVLNRVGRRPAPVVVRLGPGWALVRGPVYHLKKLARRVGSG